jgi:hypothetical protein
MNDSSESQINHICQCAVFFVKFTITLHFSAIYNKFPNSTSNSSCETMPFFTRFANFSSRANSAQSSWSSSGSISDACLLSWLSALTATADDSCCCDFIRFALSFLFSLRFSCSSFLLVFSLQAELFRFLSARSFRNGSRLTFIAALVDSATATRFASCARSA